MILKRLPDKVSAVFLYLSFILNSIHKVKIEQAVSGKTTGVGLMIIIYSISRDVP